MNADDNDCYPHLAYEANYLAEAGEQAKPVLGICLGAQLLARAMGGRVLANAAPEIGWYDVQPTEAANEDPLLGHFKPRQQVFQWHLDAIALPENCTVLARSQQCDVQAFRVGQAAWGLQFHLEVDEGLVDRWIVQPANQQAIEVAGVEPQSIRAQYRDTMPALKSMAARTFGSWIDLFELPPRKIALSSR